MKSRPYCWGHHVLLLLCSASKLVEWNHCCCSHWDSIFWPLSLQIYKSNHAEMKTSLGGDPANKIKTSVSAFIWDNVTEFQMQLSSPFLTFLHSPYLQEEILKAKTWLSYTYHPNPQHNIICFIQKVVRLPAPYILHFRHIAMTEMVSGNLMNIKTETHRLCPHASHERGAQTH